MQHVAKISCRNGVEGEFLEEEGEFRREKCNMLHFSLAEMVLMAGAKECREGFEELCSICYIISCKTTLMLVGSLLKLILK